MNTLYIFAVVLLAAAVSADWGSDKPSFCKNQDCPEYDVIQTTQDYEIRRYKSAKWVSHGDTYYGRSMRYKTGNSFWALFRYIGGSNAMSMKIPMTVPVTTRMLLCGSTDCTPEYEMSFYLESDAPTPSDRSVYVQQWPEMFVFVRSFGGWASQSDYMNEVLELAQAIGDSSLYDNSQYFQVSYDGPTSWWNRHNEVWLLVAGQ